MNHTRVYEQLIARAIQRGKPDGYSERHHIVPRALGGGDEKSNLVHLTAREHFVAHMLLAKIHGGAMWAAIVLMKGFERRYFNARLYEIGKKASAKFISELSQKRVADGTHHFAGEAGSEFQRKNQLKRVAEGKNPWAGQAGSDLNRKNALKRVAEGTHPWAGEAGSELNRKNALNRVADGTHHFAGENGSKLQLKRIENGTHPWAGQIGSDFARDRNVKRIENGTLNFLGKAGSELQQKRIENGTHPLAGKAGSELQLKRVADGTHPLAGEIGSARATKNNIIRSAEAAPLRNKIAELRKQCKKAGIKYTGCTGLRSNEYLQSYIRDLEQKLFDHAHQIEASPCDNGDWRDNLCGWFSGVGDSARFSSANF
jgi:hypothetical protein